VTHTSTGILLSHKKNEILSSETAWMKLETSFILSEINQVQIDKYQMSSLNVEPKNVNLIDAESRMIVNRGQE
jgi:hypothetical protein